MDTAAALYAEHVFLLRRLKQSHAVDMRSLQWVLPCVCVCVSYRFKALTRSWKLALHACITYIFGMLTACV